ncbi:hypothetical protein ACFLVH_02120 [Chloroflexota bacterium]
MKKILISLFLSIVLTITFAIPAFADEGNGNMPGKSADMGIKRGILNGLYLHLGWGSWISSVMSGGNANAGLAPGWYAKNHSFSHILNGEPPAKPYWAE